MKKLVGYEIKEEVTSIDKVALNMVFKGDKAGGFQLISLMDNDSVAVMAETMRVQVSKEDYSTVNTLSMLMGSTVKDQIENYRDGDEFREVYLCYPMNGFDEVRIFIKEPIMEEARAKFTVDLPETPKWEDTKFQEELNIAIAKGYTEITTPDGSNYTIINDGKVQSIPNVIYQWKTITDTDDMYTDCVTEPDFSSSILVYRVKPKEKKDDRA